MSCAEAAVPTCAVPILLSLHKSLRRLFCDYAAGDAVAGVAGGIGLHVVRFGVDDEGGAAVAEQRVGAVGEGDVGILERNIGFTGCADGEVLHVCGVMAFGIVEAVFFAVGIEMRAGGFEIRSIALGILVKVDGVLAWREIVDMNLEVDAWPLLRHDDRAYVLALCVFELDFGFGGGGKSGYREKSDEEEDWSFHAGIIELCEGSRQRMATAPMGHR
jgi:hypothetical protein